LQLSATLFWNPGPIFRFIGNWVPFFDIAETGPIFPIGSHLYRFLYSAGPIFPITPTLFWNPKRMAISDLEAIKAIDRLCRAAPRNLDLDALRVWIAAHCGLNPHAAKPLDPDAPLLAERDKLAATLAAMRDKADRLAALLAGV
jgi:hypothetical protein